MVAESLGELLDRALTLRSALLDPQYAGAIRLFNGFYEGCPDLVADLYAATVVLHNYADPPEVGETAVAAAQRVIQSRLSWVQAILVKNRCAPTPEGRCGQLIYGKLADRRVREHGVWYALDLGLNRDTSLYLDTRHLRQWARLSLAGKTILNTFAYTGSLGVAALAGGATRVVQLDRNRRFLNIAKTSYALNGLPITKSDFLTADFWPAVSRLKRAGTRFDCVFLDAPFYSTTAKGVVDLAQNCGRLINKVRPLVAHGGLIVAINNAVFVSGQAYMQTLNALCSDGYLAVETLVPVPADITGYAESIVRSPSVDPAPFNHATKIAILRVRHKPSDRDSRPADAPGLSPQEERA